MEKQLTSRRLVLVPCPVSMAQMSDGLCEQNISSHNFIYAISGFNVNCKSPLQESLARKMEKEDRNSKISCIIYDEYMYFSEEVANHLGLRSIILTTSTAANMLTHQAIPRLLKHDHIPIQDSMMLELVPGLQLLRFEDLPISNFGGLDDLLQLIAKTHDSRSSSVVIWNTMDCLEQSSLTQLQNEYQIPLFPIGLLHKTAPSPSISLLKEDQSCMSWLDEKAHNSVIYVSLGSIVFMDSKEQEEMPWDLANSEQPFLWVVRTVSLPEGHCGWNSTLKSISEEVPLICQPYFGDQRVNSRYLSQVRGVGLEWENDMNRVPIKKAIRTLMVGKEGEPTRQRAKYLKVKIELSMKQGSSSYNSLNELVYLSYHSNNIHILF
ncbi:unnamed protein product [Malus baccata var. baccata]